KAARVFGLQCRGFGPFLEMHLHERVESFVREEDFVPMNLAAARIVELAPGLRGLTGAGWLMDPRMKTISPNISWILYRTLDHGGSYCYLREDDRPDSPALVKSATRRRLYEEGTYMPQVWVRVWPRKRL